MKPRKYTRFKRNIVDETKDPATNDAFASNNRAKKESWKIQMREDGALGRGSLGII